jgi:hypothetical protein
VFGIDDPDLHAVVVRVARSSRSSARRCEPEGTARNTVNEDVFRVELEATRPRPVQGPSDTSGEKGTRGAGRRRQRRRSA